jgi:hypothetical protein
VERAARNVDKGIWHGPGYGLQHMSVSARVLARLVPRRALRLGELAEPRRSATTGAPTAGRRSTATSSSDVETAVRESHRFLRPGGVLLVTVPAFSRVDRHAGVDGDFWRFTTASCRRLFGTVFGDSRVEAHAYGNVLAAIGFLTGLAREELSDTELDVQDELFPVLVGVRAVKAQG